MAADAPHATIEVDPSASPPLVSVSGEVDAEAAPALAAALAELPDGDVAFDLAGVTFIDSSGLRVIAGAAGDAEGRGRRCTVVAASPAVERIFAMTGLSGLIER